MPWQAQVEGKLRGINGLWAVANEALLVRHTADGWSALLDTDDQRLDVNYERLERLSISWLVWEGRSQHYAEEASIPAIQSKI